nr:uncharacterized mitochondrial protein AtMg00810-like [Tanacetum cinerariifolium]
MYLTASKPDLVFAVCMCARYQASPTKKQLEALKRVFRYLKGTINWGLWYSKDTAMELTAFVDADHAGCHDTRRKPVLGYLKFSAKGTKRESLGCLFLVALSQQTYKRLHITRNIWQKWPSIKEFNDTFLNLLSNEMVSNVNVLGPRVLDVIAAESNGTTIVIIQGNLVEVKAVVYEGVPAELTRAYTAWAGETGLSTRGGSREDAFNHLAVLENLQSCISSKSNHLPSESSSSLEACSRSLQVPDPSLEGSPSPQA